MLAQGPDLALVSEEDHREPCGGTPGEVAGQISGAAVRDHCPNGTGWPSGSIR